ncbi:MAG: glycoside hydrolase family 2 TIM barrel-domain containing protein [Luteolibacter sp.]
MKSRYKFVIALLGLCGFAVGNASADRTSFDEEWKFSLGDTKRAEGVAFEDADWRVLDVPHDWSIEGDYSKDHPMSDKGGYLPAGIGWYRKTVPVSPDWKGKHVEIAFDGVFMNSTVWANGKKLGTRPYGWSSFSYDISEIADSSDSITFAVRVDNDKQPAARWYTGSGIYAHTWIDVKEKIHVPTDGIFVRTKGESVKIDAEVRNTTGEEQAAEVEITIIDPNGKEIAGMNRPVTLKTDGLQSLGFEFQVPNPQRWDIDSPHLYQAKTGVKVAGKVVDTVTTRFGIRDVEWKPETGMWLNGKNVKLQGVCNHQDAGALGAAVPDKVVRFRIEQLKAMGCNAIRTSHNPQTPIFYEICDEVGMLVMDEIFDGWSKKATHDYGRYHFADWWQRDVTDWIKRDRNHPSVVIYSVGNETHGKVGKGIVKLCHELDPTRPVTSGHSSSEYMDVFGVNGSSEKMGWFDNLETDRVFIGTENTHTWQVRGFYRTKTWFRNGYPSRSQKPYPLPDLTEKEVFSYDWTDAAGRSNSKQIFNSSYDNATVRLTARQNIEQLRDIPNYAGSFRWTGHDYIGEAGYVHGGWPFKSFMGGAIDMANFEKDLFYLYQSQWTDEPMVHILPHWTHPTLKLGTEIPVWVYSNCDEVELFFNGKSLGKKRPGTQWDEMQCQWMVGWEPGELKAIGYKGGKPMEEQIIRTADVPDNIALSVDGEALATEGKDIVQVRVTTQDEKGEFYPYGENRTAFHVIGPGRIRALDNGSPVDVETHFRAENRIAFYGLTRAYVESTGEAGDITLLASCILGEKRQVSSNKVSIDAQMLALRGALPSADIDIFYTLDGSEPTPQSTKYSAAFEVSLGTTVKALVVLDGYPVQTLEERFSADEGFVWNAAQSDSLGGDQAEDAKLSGGKVGSEGKGFQGKGYVDFGKTKGAYVEWYQENDGDAGDADLTIRYSGKAKGAKGRAVELTVNGKVVQKSLLLPNTKDWGTDWKAVSVPIRIGRGANTIRLTTVENGGMFIDEISVR